MNKSYLAIIPHLKPTPSFVGIYLFVWLLWHNEFPLSLINTNGDLLVRINSAIAAVEYNQYFFVFLLTLLVILLRHGFDYLGDLANNEDRPNKTSLLQNSTLAETESETDIKRVISALDDARVKLSDAKEQIKKLKQDKQNMVKK